MVSFPSLLEKYPSDAILLSSRAPPLHPPFLFVPEICLEGAQQKHTVYLRQIVRESEDVINVECLKRTNTGNGTGIYRLRLPCLVDQVKT